MVRTIATTLPARGPAAYNGSNQAWTAGSLARLASRYGTPRATNTSTPALRRPVRSGKWPKGRSSPG